MSSVTACEAYTSCSGPGVPTTTTGKELSLVTKLKNEYLSSSCRPDSMYSVPDQDVELPDHNVSGLCVSTKVVYM